MIRLVLIVAGLTVLAGPLAACDPPTAYRATTYQRTTYHADHYPPAIIATFALVVPAYAVGTVPTVTAPAAVGPSLDDRLGRLEAALSRLADPRTVPAPAAVPAVPAPIAAPVGARGLLMQRCAACHSDESAKGGLVLARAGELVALTEEQFTQVVGAVGAGTMPPPKARDRFAALTAADVALLCLQRSQLVVSLVKEPSR